MSNAFYAILGILLRWIFVYRCTLKKELLKKLYSENDENRMWTIYIVVILTIVLVIYGIIFLGFPDNSK